MLTSACKEIKFKSVVSTLKSIINSNNVFPFQRASLWFGKHVIVKSRVGVLDVTTNDRGGFMEMLPVYIKKAIHTPELIAIYILIN